MFYGRMRNFHIRTLADLGDDYDLRVWCVACGRGSTIAAAAVLAKFKAKGWPLDLVEARPHFRCVACRSGDHILLLPASKPPPPPPPEPEPVPPADDGRRASRSVMEQIVAGIFHFHRSEGKQARRGEPRGGYGLDGGRRTMGRWWK